MSSDIFFIHAGTALHSWLNYVSSVERRYILAENSIKYPISEFLSSHLSPDKIHFDKLHPNLLDRYLDLRLFLNNETAIEFKYSRIGYTDQLKEKKRIFNDLMRLKFFVQNGENRKGYFLICGTQLDFLKSFQSIGWNDAGKANKGLPIAQTDSMVTDTDYSKIEPKGIYSNWFKFDSGEVHTIDLKSIETELTEIYTNFFDEYDKSFKTDIDKEKIKETNPATKLIYLSDYTNKKHIPTPMKVGIWEIIVDKTK
jgi:hypothetical protein